MGGGGGGMVWETKKFDTWYIEKELCLIKRELLEPILVSKWTIFPFNALVGEK